MAPSLVETAVLLESSTLFVAVPSLGARSKLQGALVEIHQYACLLSEVCSQVLQLGGLDVVHHNRSGRLVPGSTQDAIDHHLAHNAMHLH